MAILVMGYRIPDSVGINAKVGEIKVKAGFIKERVIHADKYAANEPEKRKI